MWKEEEEKRDRQMCVYVYVCIREYHEISKVLCGKKKKKKKKKRQIDVCICIHVYKRIT